MSIEDTELYQMFIDEDHHRLKQMNWKDIPYYIKRGDTIYKLRHHWQGKVWLNQQSSRFQENEWYAYFPIAEKRDKVFVSYVYEKANTSNWLLSSYSDNARERIYPNLYWCDVGNHPYNKDIRFNHCWVHSTFAKYCHQWVLPDLDIEKAVIFPSDL